MIQIIFFQAEELYLFEMERVGERDAVVFEGGS